MRYKRNNFTEEEIEQVESLGKIVCYIFGIEEGDLRGRCRQRDFTDARKVLASCASSNIEVKSSYNIKSVGYNHLGLASWYLGMDHSTISYSINKAATLYQVDDNFKVMYDCVMAIVNNPNDDTLSKLNKYAWHKPITWEDVRDNKKFRHKHRLALAPKEVIDGIVNLYQRGYGGALISNKYSVLSSFINYVIGELKVTRLSKVPSSSRTSQLIARRSAVVKVDY
jgi:hypothetical protein